MPTPSTNWKEATDPNAGSSVIYGAPDIKKISQLFNGDVDVDDVDINSEFYFRDGKLHIVNPAGTFTYILQSSAITADRDITLPALDANDEITFNAQAQNLTNKGIDISAILGLPITATAISTDALAATSTAIEVGAESGGVDDLATITGLADDDVVALYASAGDTITVKHQTSPTADQIKLQGGVDITLDEKIPTLLVRKGGAFYQFAGSGTTTFLDNLFAIQDEGDTTKVLDFSLGGATTGFTATLVSSHTADRTITLPDATTTLVGNDTTDTLTNKTFDADGTGNSITNIENADIKTNADIDVAKVALADGTFIVGGADGNAKQVTMSGDGTLDNNGVFYLDPVRFSSDGDLLHKINLDRNHAEYVNSPFTGGWSFPYQRTATQRNHWEEFDNATDFTSDGQTLNGWRTSDFSEFHYDTTNKVLICDTSGDGSGDQISYAMSQAGGNFDNNYWVVRFRTMIKSKADGGAGGDIYFGACTHDSSQTSQQSSKDFLGLQIRNSATTTYNIRSAEADNSPINQWDVNQNVTMLNDVWYYWEIERESSTTANWKFYNEDSTYELQEPIRQDFTVSSGNNTHDFFWIGNYAGVQTGQRTMWVDDVQIWRLSTSTGLNHGDASVATNATINGTYNTQSYQDYAPFHGLNYTPEIIFGLARPIWRESFMDSTLDQDRYVSTNMADLFWLAQDGAKIDTDFVTNHRIDFECVRDNSNDGLSFQLPKLAVEKQNSGTGVWDGMADNEWELRFELEITSKFSSTTTDAELFIGVSSGDSAEGGDIAQDYACVKIMHATDNDSIGIAENDNTEAVPNDVAVTNATTSFQLNTRYYIKFMRNSATNFGLAIYSDPDFKNYLFGTTRGTAASNFSFRYFKVWNNNSVTTSDSTFSGFIKNIQLWTGANSALNGDGNGGVGLVDMHFDPTAFAIHMDTTQTTETQFKIRSNITGNLWFTDSDNIRTVDVSDFTNNVVRFININRKLEDNLDTPTHWVQIQGTTPEAQIVINRIIYLAFSSVHAHFHHRIATDSVENVWDGDDPNGAITSW